MKYALQLLMFVAFCLGAFDLSSSVAHAQTPKPTVSNMRSFVPSSIPSSVSPTSQSISSPSPETKFSCKGNSGDIKVTPSPGQCVLCKEETECYECCATIIGNSSTCGPSSCVLACIGMKKGFSCTIGDGADFKPQNSADCQKCEGESSCKACCNIIGKSEVEVTGCVLGCLYN